MNRALTPDLDVARRGASACAQWFTYWRFS
jgi:hypothetical protein